MSRQVIDIAPSRLGIPIDEETLDMMNIDKKKFFVDFLAQAKREIDMCLNSRDSLPFTPSESLRRQYRLALEVYGGRVFLPVQHMAEIFRF